MAETMPAPTMPTETCDECGFDASRWTRQDAIRTIEHAGDLVAHAVAGLDPVLANRRSRPDMWSIAEYVDHLRTVFEINRMGAELSLVEPEKVIPPFDHPAIAIEAAELDLAVVLEQLGQQATLLRDFFLAVRDDQWEHALVVDGMRWTVAYVLTHVCHDLLHHLGDIATIRRELGDTIGPLTGAVAQINASGGGVPKTAVAQGRIGAGGLDGDRQATRRHHGRPWQAICLYSADVIDALIAEGHPIDYGSTGENLTLSGIEWSALRGGMRVEIGDVVLQLSVPAVPCKKNKGFFVDGDFNRMSHDLHPGWSRWYASVLEGGDVSPGDAVTVTT